MSTPNADAWELAGFPGRLDVAAYLTADQLAAQYRVLVDVLLDAQERQRAEIAERALAARSGEYLADWAPVTSDEEAAIVWDLLTAVLRAAPGDDGSRTALTEDDRWLAIAYPSPPERPSAILNLPEGHLACENWRIEVTRA